MVLVHCDLENNEGPWPWKVPLPFRMRMGTDDDDGENYFQWYMFGRGSPGIVDEAVLSVFLRRSTGDCAKYF